ncbi:MAG: adenylyl-sulfate kinase [Pseudomonadota bacterium]|nr:adenylyl-sulfate kinase [Pseudomonadota bacterium]
MLSRMVDNEIPKVVIVGHVDHGKSSFIGRLMYDIGEIAEEKFNELKKASEKRGVKFEFAFLLDALQSERDQGITIDTTQIFFKTKIRKYVFIDAPGHKEFIRNMITGASSANIAILIIDVHEGVKQQTKKHAYLLKLLGIEKVITLYNKMDKINYSQKDYIKVKSELEDFLDKINIKCHASIPISAKIGDNIVSHSKKMHWYLGEPFVGVLDKYDISENENNDFIRLPVQDIYKKEDKRIIVGRIESGEVSKGTKLLFLPSNQKAVVQSLEVWPRAKKKYKSGDCVGITLNEQIFVDRGNIASDLITPPKLMNRFESNIFWLSDKKISFEKKYIMKINTAEYDVLINEIKNVIDTESLEQKKTKNVKKNEVCEIVIHSSQLIPMDDFSFNKKTGRFCLLDHEEIVAGGILDLKNYPDQREKNYNVEKNIVPVNLSVNEIDRSIRAKHRPGIIWLTGLSGSGKSTIAKNVEKKLFKKNFNVFTLDGDNLRIGLNKNLTFSPEDRTENIRRTAEVASLFTQAGFIVLVSLISPYRSERKRARDIRPELFREIYVKASIEVCTKRDVKGLYAKAIKGEIKNFTGISSPYEEPEKPNLVINTSLESVEKSVEKLEDYVVKEFNFSKK